MVNSKFNKKKFELCEWPFLLVYQRSEIDISKTTIVFFYFHDKNCCFRKKKICQY